jgi:shikimate dehydrogenase
MRLGLIGAGIQQSATPAMHMREAAEHGLTCTYELIDLDVLNIDATALPALLSGVEARGFRGLNITHPCKQAVISYLNELSPEAQILSAVNTVVFENRNVSVTTPTAAPLPMPSGTICSTLPKKP